MNELCYLNLEGDIGKQKCFGIHDETVGSCIEFYSLVKQDRSNYGTEQRSEIITNHETPKRGRNHSRSDSPELESVYRKPFHQSYKPVT